MCQAVLCGGFALQKRALTGCLWKQLQSSKEPLHAFDSLMGTFCASSSPAWLSAMKHTCCKSTPSFKASLFGSPFSFSPTEIVLLVVEGPLQLLTWAFLRQHSCSPKIWQEGLGWGEEGITHICSPASYYSGALEGRNGLPCLRNLKKQSNPSAV